MIILSSPAKTQDFSTEWNSVVQTEPEFLAEAAKVVLVLKDMSKVELAKVMQVSPKLAELNFERYRNWSKAEHKKNGKPAILAYRGDIFKQMYPDKYTEKQQLYAQRTVRFLTGLYGMLRAYDLMLPYRLEMKATVPVGKFKDLNQLWAGKLTASLNRDLAAEKNPLLVDAASGEYSKPIDFGALEGPWVRVEFREKDLRNVGILSKKARGMLLEYCIVNQVQTVEELKKFNMGGYKFLREAKHEVMFAR
ncbi:MAG: uncharacterized protein QG639_577 [Patescibacteria group bacterium]|nr:uncharacterized protein [Patescibacteria group bacterium]